MIETEVKKLTTKEKRFADRYLYEAKFNGTEAARGVYDAASDNTLAQIAYQNLRKLHIKQYVDEGLAAMAMSGNEVIARLNDIAKGKVTDFYNADGKFDLEVAKDRQVEHLLKKIKRKTTSKVLRDQGEIETHLLFEEIEFEIYSAHEALRDLGKVHKLFVDKIEQETSMVHSLDADTIRDINKGYDEQIGDSKD